MKKILAVVFAVSWLAGGCAPSAPFKIGKGFYSEKHAQSQVNQADSDNRAEKIASFKTEAYGCGDYSAEKIDANIMNPAIREELKRLDADAAANVKAEENIYSLINELLVLPALLGCTNWDVTGDALRISEPAPVPTASFDMDEDTEAGAAGSIAEDTGLSASQSSDDLNDFAGAGFVKRGAIDEDDDIDISEIAMPPSREATIYPYTRGQGFHQPETVTTELTPWTIDKNDCVETVRGQESEPHVPAFLGCMRTKGWFLKDQVENFELEKKMMQEMNTGS